MATIQYQTVDTITVTLADGTTVSANYPTAHRAYMDYMYGRTVEINGVLYAPSSIVSIEPTWYYETVDMTDNSCVGGGGGKGVIIVFPTEDGTVEVTGDDFIECGANGDPVFAVNGAYLTDGDKYSWNNETSEVSGGVLTLNYGNFVFENNAEVGVTATFVNAYGDTCEQKKADVIDAWGSEPIIVTKCDYLTTIPHASGSADVTACDLTCVPWESGYVAQASLPSNTSFVDGTAYDYAYNLGGNVTGTVTVSGGNLYIPNSTDPVVGIYGRSRYVRVHEVFNTCEDATKNAIAFLSTFTLTKQA